IEKVVKNLQYDDKKDYFKKFLNYIVNRRKLPENIRIAIVNKISSFLHDEKTIEEKMFALQIVDRIDIPKDKKNLIKELLKGLNNDGFEGEEKALFLKVKKKK